MPEAILYNTLTRRLEPLRPLVPPTLGVYCCGPTVYDYAHIGNFRFFVWADVLRRFLRWRGYDVTFVMNITDVDDKTIAGARAAGQSLQQFTDTFATAFVEDLEILRIQPADHLPRATEHIDDMVRLVQQLLEGGYAYERDGSVYFRIASFSEYGRLARLDPSQLRSAGRIEEDAYDKQDGRDFALWKAAKEDEPCWQTELGAGRPGWHMECSAMSMKYLGTGFDLHLGGVDLIFPHHENEIAQSEAATGTQFVQHWAHCAHLMVDGAKMSKSLGNFYTLRKLLEDGHDPIAIRFLLASVHYRRPLNFTLKAVEQAAAAISRLRDFLVRAQQDGVSVPTAFEGTGELTSARCRAETAFATALDDDLNVAGALGHLFSFVKEANTVLDQQQASRAEIEEALGWLRNVDTIWAVLPAPEALSELQVDVGGQRLLALGPGLAPELEEMIVERLRARARGDFDAADDLREQLARRGVLLEDTLQGTRWHREDQDAG